jgi:hypothetical protein
MAWTRRLLLLACAALALVGAAPAGDAAALVPTEDRWSGRWEVTFTNEGNGAERVAGPLCCVEVTPLSEERGRALVSGTTGDPADNTFIDILCSGAGSQLFFEATSPFEFVSGHLGVVPGPEIATKGSRAVFCTDGADAIRGHYKNDLGAFDPLMGKPVSNGSFLARRTGTQPGFDGSLTRFPGDFPGPTFHSTWEGTCISGACRQVQRRPTLRTTRLSTYNALLGFLRGARGARLELTRPDGTSRPLRLGEKIELEAGDVVTSHGTYAEIAVTRFDGTTTTIAIEPGGSIEGLGDPGLLRHRGGRVIAGSLAGFTADSAVFDAGPNEAARGHAEPTRSVRTTVGPGGKVSLELDPARRHLVVRALAGTASVTAGSSSLTLAKGQEARATGSAVVRLAPPPDLARTIGAATVLTSGPVRLTAPGRLGTRALARARCLRTRIQSTGGAKVLVTLLVGTARKGNVVLQKRLTVIAGTDRALCLALPPKARGIPAGTPLTIALGVRAGTRRTLATRAVALTAA